ncbi:adenylosuccinate synthase [Longicatena caecimuris]|uniref:adenylosuccinate synthase n=1 Tax=Longicatena caecimuris TaxID=1796635 RepID=UPI0022E085D5|nr:adenylosuccinate synthase [Longicatena caecimuris]
MPGYVVVGTQWGDEGKGKVVDYLGSHMDYVVRFQGGNNAGHTVVVNDDKVVLHLLPSGVLQKALCIIGPGVVVDPFVFLEEIKALEEKGLPTEHVKISDCSHIIMPYHVRLDSLQEAQLQEAKIGTTKRGIGPCYADKYSRIGLRMGDLKDFEQFKKKLKRALEMKNILFHQVYQDEGFVYEDMVQQFAQIREKLLPRIVNAQLLVNEALDTNKQVLFEGAQAAMLDINYGNYPYVTSSSPTSAGVCTGAGVAPQKLDVIIGIAKAYSTRVGEGPFPCELFDEEGDTLREKGGEYGATTGRPRRCGWLDVNVVRHAAMINGLTDLVITKLDILSGFDKIKMCVAYEIDGQRYDYIPSNIEDLQKAKPIYEIFDGWNEDIANISHYDELPENAKIYLRRIEELCHTKISMISVGPERNSNIIVHEMLK